MVCSVYVASRQLLYPCRFTKFAKHFAYYYIFLVFDFRSTYMCPVNEKNSTNVACYTGEPLFMYIYLLLKLRETPINPVWTHRIGFYIT